MEPKKPVGRKNAEKDKRIKEVGSRIKSLRKANGSIEKFAYEAGFSRSHAWGLEQGADFKISTLLRIVDTLDVSLAEFFKEFK